MVSDELKGHLSIAGAYTIFGLNVVLCKDIANAQAVAPIVLFALRALGASALFWIGSLSCRRRGWTFGTFRRLHWLLFWDCSARR